MPRSPLAKNFIRVRNFEQYQHYKDRRPPWVKLYRDLWQDPNFYHRSDHVKLYIIGCFTLASETDNKIPADPKWIQSRLAINKPPDIKELIDSTFIEAIDFDASDMLASCNMKVDINKKCSIVEEEEETEVQRREEKRERRLLCEIGKSCNGKMESCNAAFEEFWKIYPRHSPPRKEARKSWCRQFSVGLDIDRVMSWIREAVIIWDDPKFIPMPTTWINQRRWEGELPPIASNGSKRREVDPTIFDFPTEEE